MSGTAWSGDVIVAGAGPAGSACAALLSRAGLRVLLVDRGAGSPWQPVEVLAPATVRLLRSCGLFEAAFDHEPGRGPGYARCRGVRGLWGRDADFFDYSLFACDAGVAVERDAFDRELRTQAAAAGAQMLATARVEQAQREPDGTWRVRLAAVGGGITASANVLIDATGRASRNPVAPASRRPRAAGPRRFFDSLVGIACRLPLPAQTTQIMLLEADADGWWYSSCDAHGRGAAVYLSDADLLPRTAPARASFFRRKFAESRLIRDQLPALPASLDLRMIDARTSRRTCLVDQGTLAIGDAAYSVDPLSGGGLRRAVETARHAAMAVQAWLGSGDADALARYEAWADADFGRWHRDKDGVYATADPSILDRPFWRRRTRGAHASDPAVRAESSIPSTR
jgi:flavin-dependent dehydrogenase